MVVARLEEGLRQASGKGRARRARRRASPPAADREKAAPSAEAQRRSHGPAPGAARGRLPRAPRPRPRGPSSPGANARSPGRSTLRRGLIPRRAQGPAHQVEPRLAASGRRWRRRTRSRSSTIVPPSVPAGPGAARRSRDADGARPRDQEPSRRTRRVPRRPRDHGDAGLDRGLEHPHPEGTQASSRRERALGEDEHALPALHGPRQRGRRPGRSAGRRSGRRSGGRTCGGKCPPPASAGPRLGDEEEIGGEEGQRAGMSTYEAWFEASRYRARRAAGARGPRPRAGSRRGAAPGAR